MKGTCKMSEYVKFLMVGKKSTELNFFDYIKNLKNSISTDFQHYSFVTYNKKKGNEFESGNNCTENILMDEEHQWFRFDIVDQSSTTTVWEVEFQFGTFEKSVHLEITISSDNYNLAEDNTNLEDLKCGIKDLCVRDWNKVIWLMDRDSELLSTNLYPLIYKTENLTRQFINKLMIQIYGVDWWDKLVPQNISKKHKGRLSGYKSIVGKYKNIDEKLMSIDTGDLLDIFLLKGFKWEPSYDTKINDFLIGKIELDNSNIKSILGSQTTDIYDLWNDLFCNYLPSDFQTEFKSFVDNRNHVMHNKLIDRAAAQIIRDSIDKVTEAINKALLKADKEVLSQEQKDINIAQLQQLKEEQNDSYQSIAEEESGVSIRSIEDIRDIFDEHITRYFDDFEDILRFRSYLNVTIHSFDLSRSPNKFLTITRNYDGKELVIVGKYEELSSDPGSSSILNIYFQGCEDIYTVDYINGDYYFNDEQSNYMPVTRDKFNLDEEKLTDFLLEKIDDELKSPFEEIKGEVFESVRNGESDVLLETECCQYCGECNTIYVGKELAEKGICLICGELNELTECPRCYSQFVGGITYDDGTGSYCEVCKEEIDSF